MTIQISPPDKKEQQKDKEKEQIKDSNEPKNIKSPTNKTPLSKIFFALHNSFYLLLSSYLILN